MNLRETIPPQSDIEEFLGRDFFPKYSKPQTVLETIDIVQLQFGIPDEARALKCPRGHGTEGSLLEALVLFAMVRLEERGFLVHVGTSTYRWKSGVRYFSKAPRKDVEHCLYRLRTMTEAHVPLEQAVSILIDAKWTVDAVLTAQSKLNLTPA
jgi:hypothetical protein